MKKYTIGGIIGIIIMLMFMSCSDHVKSVNAEEFKAMIEGKEVQLLDVRTPEEYADGHIMNAINIDCQSSDFIEIANEHFDKDQPVYVYCHSGKRSLLASIMLSGEGYEIVNLKSGIVSWYDAGYPMTAD